MCLPGDSFIEIVETEVDNVGIEGVRLTMRLTTLDCKNVTQRILDCLERSTSVCQQKAVLRVSLVYNHDYRRVRQGRQRWSFQFWGVCVDEADPRRLIKPLSGQCAVHSLLLILQLVRVLNLSLNLEDVLNNNWYFHIGGFGSPLLFSDQLMTYSSICVSYR